MNFLFPANVKHLPNDEQLRLLFELTCTSPFPGFLHPSSLRVTKRDPVKMEQIDLNERVKVKFNSLSYMTHKDLAHLLTTTPYLYFPFDHPKTYIMITYNDVIGMVRSGDLETYWFESPISLGEIYTAEKYNIPIVTQFVRIGRSAACDLCGGHGIVDWVEEIKSHKDYKKVPSDRYIFATHSYIYFLIDNQSIHSYNGNNIIYPCPRCLGSGLDGVVVKDNEEIKSIIFDEYLLKYRLLIKESRPHLINMSDYQ